MGYSLNPVEYRLGYVRSWEDSWYLKGVFYPIFLHKVLILKSLINYLMYYGVFFNRKKEWVFSHSEFSLYKNKIYVRLYLYDIMMNNFANSYSSKFNARGRSFFVEARLGSYWMKKQLLDQRWSGQKLARLLMMINYYIDFQLLDSSIFRAKSYEEFMAAKREIKKLNSLRKRFGPRWLGVEDIVVWQNLFFYYDKETKNDFYYLRWLKWFFRLFYSKKAMIKNIERFNIDNKWSYSETDIRKLSVIRSNLYKLYFILLFLARLMKLFVFYPRHRFRRDVLYFIFRTYYTWFYQKPIFEQFKDYWEWILLFFGLEANVFIYSVTNVNLSASFISRFIAEALELKFNFRDLMGLLRYNMRKHMYKRRVVEYKDFSTYLKDKYSLKKRSSIAEKSVFLTDSLYLKMWGLNCYSVLVRLQRQCFHSNVYLKQLDKYLVQNKKKYKFFRKLKHKYSDFPRYVYILPKEMKVKLKEESERFLRIRLKKFKEDLMNEKKYRTIVELLNVNVNSAILNVKKYRNIIYTKYYQYLLRKVHLNLFRIAFIMWNKKKVKIKSELIEKYKELKYEIMKKREEALERKKAQKKKYMKYKRYKKDDRYNKENRDKWYNKDDRYNKENRDKWYSKEKVDDIKEHWDRYVRDYIEGNKDNKKDDKDNKKDKRDNKKDNRDNKDNKKDNRDNKDNIKENRYNRYKKDDRDNRYKKDDRDNRYNKDNRYKKDDRDNKKDNRYNKDNRYKKDNRDNRYSKDSVKKYYTNNRKNNWKKDKKFEELKQQYFWLRKQYKEHWSIFPGYYEKKLKKKISLKNIVVKESFEESVQSSEAFKRSEAKVMLPFFFRERLRKLKRTFFLKKKENNEMWRKKWDIDKRNMLELIRSRKKNKLTDNMKGLIYKRYLETLKRKKIEKRELYELLRTILNVVMYMVYKYSQSYRLRKVLNSKVFVRKPIIKSKLKKKLKSSIFEVLNNKKLEKINISKDVIFKTNLYYFYSNFADLKFKPTTVVKILSKDNYTYLTEWHTYLYLTHYHNNVYAHFIFNTKFTNNFSSILKFFNRRLYYEMLQKAKINEVLEKNGYLWNKFFSRKGGFAVSEFRSNKKSKYFFKTQESRLKIINNKEALLFGYKFNFVGRFSRKQRSSNYWFSEGGVPSASITANVDFGSFSVNLKNSRCTVKVWLYKNEKTPVFLNRFD